MTEERLRILIESEIRVWSQKPISQLLEELAPRQWYDRGSGDDWHQFEVEILEHTADYIHVMIAVDDGSHQWSRSPVCSSFIVHRNGRIES